MLLMHMREQGADATFYFSLGRELVFPSSDPRYVLPQPPLPGVILSRASGLLAVTVILPFLYPFLPSVLFEQRTANES